MDHQSQSTSLITAFCMSSGTMGPEPVVGSVTPNQGSLYLLQADNDPVTEVSPVSISNGLAWNKDNTLMYFIDTATGQVDVFDFDLEKATLGE
jgi:gluconolactonase